MTGHQWRRKGHRHGDHHHRAAGKQQDKKEKEDVFHAKPVKHKPNSRNKKGRDYGKGKLLE